MDPGRPTVALAVVLADAALAARVRRAASAVADVVADTAAADVVVADRGAVIAPGRPGRAIVRIAAPSEIADTLSEGCDDAATPAAAPQEIVARAVAAAARPRSSKEVAAAAPEVVGESRALRRALRRLDDFADAPALTLVRIEGEFATGRMHAALRLHARSRRAGLAPVVADAATAAPDELRAALFGDAASRGAIVRARGSTLVLRNAQEAPADVTAALAKWLVTRVVPCGADCGAVSDARLVVTSDAARGKPVVGDAGALSAVIAEMPPLRERGADAALLLAHFLQRFAQDPPTIGDDARDLLAKHAWPGNVAEVIALATLLAVRGPGRHVDALALLPLLAFPSATGGEGELAGIPTLAEVRLGHVLRVLHLAGGARGRAAKALGITPRTLYNHLRNLPRADGSRT